MMRANRIILSYFAGCEEYLQASTFVYEIVLTTYVVIYSA